MEVCFITNSTLTNIEEQKLGEIKDSELVIFGFNGLGLVSYKKELSGETEYFQDLAKFSKQISSVVICGCDTDTYGVFRHSAVVADKGRILGVTDMMNQIGESEYVAGGAVKVYETSVGKIGIIIAEDLYFPKVSEILAVCDADFIVCIFHHIDGQMPQIVLRSSAFINGLPMSLIAKSYALISDEKGSVTMASSSDLVFATIKKEKNYTLITTRKRGIVKP